jgi:hypothetical protein
MNSTFKQWISQTHGYTDKTVRDVVSRLNRVRKLVKLTANDSQESILDMLEKNNKFKSCGYSVKSQLRKSVKLHFEFLESNKNNISPSN